MKSFHQALVALCLSASVLYVPGLHAAVIWDESINADLSNTQAASTALPSLVLGDNRVIGSIGIFWGSDDDVASFVVPAGYELAQVILEHYDYGT